MLELADSKEEDLVLEGPVYENLSLRLLEKDKDIIKVLQHRHLYRLFTFEEEYQE